jgi:hypothetical protein
MYQKSTTDTRTALAMIKNSSEILSILLDGGHSTIAGRLAGAFRNIGQSKIADDIVKTMQKAGYDVRETDPFQTPSPIAIDTTQRVYTMPTPTSKPRPIPPGATAEYYPGPLGGGCLIGHWVGIKFRKYKPTDEYYYALTDYAKKILNDDAALTEYFRVHFGEYFDGFYE